MKTMELEQMTLEELASVKGGIWVMIDGVRVWFGDKSLIPEEEDE